MPSMERFAPTGLLALDVRAYGEMFPAGSPPENRIDNRVAIVTVSGPIASRADARWDSYEAILARVDTALAAKPPALLLAIDSPGGMAQGCYEAARELRARCQSAGVPLHAYVGGAACSAAYALACAAESIAITATGVVGSIGVYQTLCDQTALDAAMGLKYRVVAIGARKTDGNPHVAISDGAVAAAEVAAEYLGGLFFGLVEELRGIPAGHVRSLDGGIAIGSEAVTKRLADVEVANLSQFLSQLLGTVSVAPVQASQMVKTMDEIKKALQAIIDDPNASEDDKAKAKAGLAALAGTSTAEPAATEGSGDGEKSDEMAAKALAEVHKLRAELASRDAKLERDTLLATRPDFSAELRATLMKAPIETVRDMVATLPRVAFQPAASANVQPTLGAGQGAAQPRLDAEAKAALDARMGLHPTTLGVEVADRVQRFGVPMPKKA